ncbi:MAG: GDSL-type esterase/lipase family protein [Clostridia bacterium]|nr:GDSL-type esterase/lipase family protein [Clostridia bacterium]
MKKNILKKCLSAVLAAVLLAACLPVTLPVGVSAAAEDITLDFRDSHNAENVILPNNTDISYSEEENSLMLTCNGKSDPYVTINVEAMAQVSADDYKYVVLTYRTPKTNSSSADMTELFMCAGDMVSYNPGYSVAFSPVNGYKYRSQILNMSGKDYWTGNVHKIRLDVFESSNKWDMLFLSAVTFCESEEAAKLAAAKNASAANGVTDGISEQTLASNKYDLGVYTSNYWEGNIVYNESVYPLKNPDGTISPQSMMYDIKRVISVRNGQLNIEYQYGKDYVVEDGKLCILTTGRIPAVNYSDYKTDGPVSGITWMERRGGGYVFFSEGSVFHNAQIFVTYTHEDEWDKTVPESGIDSLSATYSKLSNKEHVTAVFFGDSITYGANASGLNGINVSPNMPLWADMTVAGLKSKYGYADISYVNTAVGGKDSTWGASTVFDNVTKYLPDIVFLGFGMNDGTLGIAPSQFKANIKSIIDSVRTYKPECEFVLVSTMVANPETYFAGLQEEYLPVLKQLSDEYTGVFTADMTTAHKELLEVKKYADMTGNNVNHPNDFLIRYYAQVMLASLSPYDIVKVREEKSAKLLSYADPSRYRAQEQIILTQTVEKGIQSIGAAQTLKEATAALKLAMAEIDKIKTKAQYDAENLDYTRLEFKSEAAVAAITGYNSTAASLEKVAGHPYARIASKGSDPYFRISYDGKALSADKYKYIALVYYVPDSVLNNSITEMFFTAGNNMYESQSMSVSFTAVHGAYSYIILDMTGKDFWSGSIHNIRIDPFNSYMSGDSMHIFSLCLFENKDTAAAYAARKTDILSGNYKGVSESLRFESEASVSYLQAQKVSVLSGDVDFNGSVNALDSYMLKEYLCQTREFLPSQADATGDGAVNAKDAYAMLSYLSGVTQPQMTQAEGATVQWDSASAGAKVTGLTGEKYSVLADMSGKGLSLGEEIYVSFVCKTETAAAATVAVVYEDGTETEAGIQLKGGGVFAYETPDLFCTENRAKSISGVKIALCGEETETVNIYSITVSDVPLP